MDTIITKEKIQSCYFLSPKLTANQTLAFGRLWKQPSSRALMDQWLIGLEFRRIQSAYSYAEKCGHNIFSHQIKLPVFRILFVGRRWFHKTEIPRGETLARCCFHDFNQFWTVFIIIKNLEFQSFLSYFPGNAIAGCMSNKRLRNLKKPPRCVNTSIEIFSKRIYHSRNSVTHTESNQQHSIFLYCWSTNAICCYHCAKKVLNCWCNQFLAIAKRHMSKV